MKRTIAAVVLVLAILAVGYWGMAGWLVAGKTRTECPAK